VGVLHQLQVGLPLSLRPLLGIPCGAEPHGLRPSERPLGSGTSNGEYEKQEYSAMEQQNLSSALELAQ
jgi:hypothetical protein